ncbi:MAG: DUF3016 domain-containing protein [Opitutaceae bacterium]
MKTATLSLVAALIITPAFGASEDTGKDVTVEFLEPEKFRDFETRRGGGEKDREALEKSFRKMILEVAERYLPPGYKLALRFRDIDMAGDFEPERGPDFDDVRIVKAIYPPSFNVEYEITAENGEVVASGTKRMSDLAFQNTVSFRKDEPLFYEEELIRDFLREITRPI